MAVLRQLADPSGYRPCEWDLKRDAHGRAYWIDLFCWHLEHVLVPMIIAEYAPDEQRLADFRREYLAEFDDIAARPEMRDELNVLLLTEIRRDLSARHGFPDPFLRVKQRANEATLKLLPELLAELDAASRPRLRELLVHGLMAGNLFDLGTRETAGRPEAGNSAFRATRDENAGGRWLRNDTAAWWARWDEAGHYRHAAYFVDNAGGDVLLGNLPLARWMLKQGARVTLAANSIAALNDITAEELVPLIDVVSAQDPIVAGAWRERRLQVRATGSRAPLLDLSRLDSELVDTIADADLIILHGMGRSIESNYDVRLSCDVLHTAVLKDKAVAAHVGGAPFDRVFRLRPA